MKSSRFRHSYRKSASILHRKVGDILRSSSALKNYRIYQEYPVNRVVKGYPHGNHHFDWVILDLKVVIECHGEQHYRPVAFDGDQEAAIERFHEGQVRDKQKQDSAIAAGWTYIVVPYTDQKRVDEQYLLGLITLEEISSPGYTVSCVEKDEEHEKQLELKKESSRRAKERRKNYLSSDEHKERLAKAREHRRDRYRKLKDKYDRR